MTDKYVNELNTIADVAGADYLVIQDQDALTDLKKVTAATLKTYMLSTYTASRAMETDGAGAPSASDITATELGYLDGVTENIQTHMDSATGHTHTIAHHTNMASPDDYDVIYGDSGGWVQNPINTLLAGSTSFTNHSARHENGGADEISVTGLSGTLADAQTPAAHALGFHSDTGAIDTTPSDYDAIAGDSSNWVSMAGSSFVDGAIGFTIASHASRHENGGADEISVAGLSGTLADAQTPAAHTMTTYHTGGSEVVFYTNNAGVMQELAIGSAGTVCKGNGTAIVFGDVVYTDVDGGYVTGGYTDADGNTLNFQNGILTSVTPP